VLTTHRLGNKSASHFGLLGVSQERSRSQQACPARRCVVQLEEVHDGFAALLRLLAEAHPIKVRGCGNAVQTDRKPHIWPLHVRKWKKKMFDFLPVGFVFDA
jgi:hypothetical protein